MDYKLLAFFVVLSLILVYVINENTGKKDVDDVLNGERKDKKYIKKEDTIRKPRHIQRLRVGFQSGYRHRGVSIGRNVEKTKTLTAQDDSVLPYYKTLGANSK